MRLILFIIISFLLTISASAQSLPKSAPKRLSGYSDLDSVKARISANPAPPIVGVWQMVPDGALIAIESADNNLFTTDYSSNLRMVIIDSPNRELRPGTLLGVLKAGGDPSIFEAEMYIELCDGHLVTSRKFTLHLDSEQGRFELRKRKSKIRINLWRLMPFLWRNTVTFSDNNSSYYPGAVRLHPSPSRPLIPVYL